MKYVGCLVLMIYSVSYANLSAEAIDRMGTSAEGKYLAICNISVKYKSLPGHLSETVSYSGIVETDSFSLRYSENDMIGKGMLVVASGIQEKIVGQFEHSGMIREITLFTGLDTPGGIGCGQFNNSCVYVKNLEVNENKWEDETLEEWGLSVPGMGSASTSEKTIKSLNFNSKGQASRFSISIVKNNTVIGSSYIGFEQSLICELKKQQN